MMAEQGFELSSELPSEIFLSTFPLHLGNASGPCPCCVSKSFYLEHELGQSYMFLYYTHSILPSGHLLHAMQASSHNCSAARRLLQWSRALGQTQQ
jgi:hypothetical protein